MIRKTFLNLSKLLVLFISIFVLIFGDIKEGVCSSYTPMGLNTNQVVIEHLRISVPEVSREAWLDAERGSWEPWLRKQEGFLGRQLFWDPINQEATLFITWENREQWKAIPEAEINKVQIQFDKLSRQFAGVNRPTPFPLVFEGELRPQ